MGYSSRYHLASLAAVFVALAVGILIGAALGSDVITGTAENLEGDLGEDLDRLRAENAELLNDLERERALSSELYPAVVGGRLARQEVALVGFGDVDTSALTEDVRAALRATGAELVEVAAIREPPDVDALTGALEIRASGRAALAAAARQAGRLLAGSDESPAALGDSFLSSFSGDPEAAGIDAVVVARSRPEEMGEREIAMTETLEAGVIAGMREAGARLVGAEVTDDEPSSIEFFATQDLATVDNIDQLSGRVSLVLALAGAEGNFGVKETAESLLPNVISASPGLGESAGGG